MRLSSGFSGAGNRIPLYSRGFETRIIEKNRLPYRINPLFADKNVLHEAKIFENRTRTDRWAAIYELFEKIKIGGTHGITYDLTSERPDGCLNATEIFRMKRGCCLEQTFLFLSIATNGGFNQKETDVIGFLIYSLQDGAYDLHACPGLLLKTTLRGDYARLNHHKFLNNTAFRKEILEVANARESENYSLILLDLTYPEIGAQHKHIVPMSDAGIVAAYLTNSGENFHRRGSMKEAVARWSFALQIEEKEVLALSNLIAEEYDANNWTRVVSLTEDIGKIVNPIDLLRRSEASRNIGEWSVAEPYRALGEDPKCVDAYLYLARIYIENGDRFGALSVLSGLRRQLKSTINEGYRNALIPAKKDEKASDQLLLSQKISLKKIEGWRVECEELIKMNIAQSLTDTVK